MSTGGAGASTGTAATKWSSEMTTATNLQPPRSPHSGTTTLDITVLMGGPSAEREVSLNSGKAVADALRRRGHRVNCCDISPGDLSALDKPADLIFIALHGTFGEDGQLQTILANRGMAYVGSDAASSRLAMDKVESKKRFVAAGIATPAWKIITQQQLNHQMNSWRLPTVIKPVDQGSSVDTFIARDAYGFQAAMERVVVKYGRCLIEDYIAGPELTVGILGNTALPVCEIRTTREYYDYAAKYLDDATEYLFDLDLPADLLQTVRALSIEAHHALGCRDFSRVDWMVDAKTHQPYILELNTIPGFTDHSLLPKAAARANIGFDQLCQKIIEQATSRAS